MGERTAWKTCSDLGSWSVFGTKRGRNGKGASVAGPETHTAQRALACPEPSALGQGVSIGPVAGCMYVSGGVALPSRTSGAPSRAASAV
jgi:hypothetical protein